MKIIDMHCDTISEIGEKRDRELEERVLRENEGHLDLIRMKQSGYLLQNFALFVNTGARSTDPWEQVCALYRIYQEELEKNQDLIAPALRYDEIAANEAAGKMSALLTVEEGAVCHGELRKLDRLYEMGVRMLTLTWNHPNELGYPNLNRENGTDFLFIPERERGLTERGRDFVRRMEELGMIVDVSHLSDAGFADVLECSSRPFVASHSNAREVCGCVRNLTDDMIRRLAERGGCMGLNFCADFLETVPEGQQNRGSLAAAVRHARHIVNVGGIEVLGLGSDFDGIDTNEELPGAQSMGGLWDALHGAGFTEGQLDRIFYGNVLRVYREILG